MIVWNFWVMWCLLFQPWAVLAVCDRSDRSMAAALFLCLLECVTWHIASRIYLCCSHTPVAPHGCWYLGGVSFVLNMCILACEANLRWIPFICTYWGGALTKSENSKALLNIFLKALIGLSSITKKGEIERASWPLVCFGGLIDTTIKGLTILLSILAGID